MGQTREKKQSKRSLKAQQQAEETLTPRLADLDLSGGPQLSSDSSSLSSPSYLSVPTPSSRSSHSIKSQSSRTTLSSSSPAADAKDISPAKDAYDPNLIEVRHTPNKGFAIFATRRIAPGTLVLAETPVIRISGADEAAGDAPADAALYDAFSALERPQQKEFRALHDSQKAGFTQIKSIYYSNCYNLSFRSSEGGSCIGLMASRINHSCVPNVQFSFSDGLEQLLFYAIRPIARGKEVLGTYDTVFETRVQRQKKQVMYYGFRCDCEACVPTTEFWEKSDERRTELVMLRKDVKRAERKWDEGERDIAETECVLANLKRMESLMMKECLMGDCLANVYKSLAKWANRAGNKVEELEWKVRQRDVLINCGGKVSARVLAIDETM